MYYRTMVYLCLTAMVMAVYLTGCGIGSYKLSSNAAPSINNLAASQTAGQANPETSQKMSSLDQLVALLRMGADEQKPDDSMAKKTDSEETQNTTLSAAGKQTIEIADKVKSGKASPNIRLSSKKIQQALKNAGYYSGAVDGKIGGETTEAIGRFQQDHKLRANGVISRETVLELSKHL
ncbi:MAG: peptidoglycan-binding domain-containing protein [Candidatus Wallbacteria bacterium]|nr:peptidoglycan-binding domain-containing protein [Candidatus Wallbacteria bacterium]